MKNKLNAVFVKVFGKLDDSHKVQPVTISQLEQVIRGLSEEEEEEEEEKSTETE
jgi:hypothetical protein